LWWTGGEIASSGKAALCHTAHGAVTQSPADHIRRHRASVEAARALVSRLPGVALKAQHLALYVSNRLGGEGTADLGDRTERAIDDARSHDHRVLIGRLTAGVCRHRAILFKYLADQVGLPCRLVRGYHGGMPDQDGGAHVWNTVPVRPLPDGSGYEWHVVDVMQSPDRLLPENSPEAAEYVRYEPGGGNGGLMQGVGGGTLRGDREASVLGGRHMVLVDLEEGEVEKGREIGRGFFGKVSLWCAIRLVLNGR
jgi:hypothetical protein